MKCKYFKEALNVMILWSAWFMKHMYETRVWTESREDDTAATDTAQERI